MTNEEILNKAVMTADAIASAGALPPDMVDRLIDYVVDETAWKNNARVERIKAQTWEVHKIGIGNRILVPSSEARDPGVRRGITPSKVVLTPHDVAAPFEIGSNLLDWNIERAALEDHIVRLMARAVANDLEDYCINGDSVGIAALESDLIDSGGSSTQYLKDPLMALTDGWLRLADSAPVAQIVNAANANIGAGIFSAAIRALPTKFRRNRAALRFFCSPDLAQNWRERVAARATAAGDGALGSDTTVKPFGIPLIEVPKFAFNPPIVQHVQLNGTTAVALRYAPVQNVVVLPSTLASTPTTPFINVTDYTLDLTAGTIARTGGGAIGDGVTVKVSYEAGPQLILTDAQNCIIGIGREMTMKKGEDIFRDVRQYVLRTRVGVQVEEVTALVKVKNIGTGV